MSRSMQSFSCLNFSQFLKLSSSIPAQLTSLSQIELAQSGPQVQCEKSITNTLVAARDARQMSRPASSVEILYLLWKAY